MELIQNSLRLTRLALAGVCLAVPVTGYCGMFKADPASVTPFLENKHLTSDSKMVPFNKVWRNPSSQAWSGFRSCHSVYVAPVNTRYLATPHSPQKDVAAMAEYMRTRFEKQFAKAGYRVVSRPGPGTISVDLALTGLKPTVAPGKFIAKGASVMAPGADIVAEQFTRGSIAIEGKIRNGATGQTVAAFADREHDKTSLVSLRDYTSHGHARQTVNDWSKEVTQFVKAPANQKVRGASRVTLNPL